MKYTTKYITAKYNTNTGKYLIKNNGEVVALGWGLLKYVATITDIEENTTKPIREIIK